LNGATLPLPGFTPPRRLGGPTPTSPARSPTGRHSANDADFSLSLPPPLLRPLHRPAFVTDFWRRMRARLVSPATVENDLLMRRVNVLGHAIYEFLLDGTVAVRLRELAPDGGWRWHRIAPGSVCIVHAPFGDTWLARFREEFLVRYRVRHGDPGEGLDGYADWAFRIFGKHIRREGLARAMRAKVSLALAADPFAVAIARRAMRRDHGYPAAVRVDDYNHVVRHRAEYAKLQRENANLMLLYAIFADDPDFPRHGEPAQRLMRHLAGIGVSPRVWRLVAGARPRFFGAQIAHYPWPWWLRRQAACDFLGVLEALRCTRLPPDWLLWDLVQTWHVPEGDSGSLAKFVRAFGMPLARIVGLHERADARGQARIAAGFYDVLSWLIDARPVRVAATMRGACWPWFERRAGEWFAAQRARLTYEDRHWPVPFRSRVIDGLEVVFLQCGYELWLESRQMRHCAETWVDDCAKGTRLVASIRSGNAKRPLATVGFERGDDGWRLAQVRGYANQPATGRAAAVTRTIEAGL
jgi:hypothetical protein